MSVHPSCENELWNSVRKEFAAVLLAIAVLTGCTVGPKYRKAAMPLPEAYRGSTNQKAEALAASFADLPWWQVFQDPVLQDLIRKTLQHNYDLQLATERITAARAQLMVTRADQFPQVTASGLATDGRFFNGGFAARTRYSTYAADATFQLDLFGGLRRATESARAQLLSTEYAQKTEILTLVSDVASDYFALLASIYSYRSLDRRSRHSRAQSSSPT